MAAAKSELIGARFKMSALGSARNPRLAAKEGTIVGSSRYSRSVRVRFDSSKTAVTIHEDYIELISPETR
jgi:hypothetical protein